MSYIVLYPLGSAHSLGDSVPYLAGLIGTSEPAVDLPCCCTGESFSVRADDIVSVFFLWRDPAENRILIVLPLWDCGGRDSAVRGSTAPRWIVMDLLKARLSWVELYARTGGRRDWSAAAAGSRPTLRKWWRRFQSEGEASLIEKSRRPHRYAARMVVADQEALILALRRLRRLGGKQLRNELFRQHQMVLTLDTRDRGLLRHQ